MAKITMVRHGKAEAGFGGAMDPGLDALGRAQAQAVAQKLAAIGPLPILSSPLARTQQTAAPLAALWSQKPVIADAVAEIPSPKGMTLEARVAWLRKLMSTVSDSLTGKKAVAAPSADEIRELGEVAK